MSWRNIGIVYRKELTDMLRDRRTLISMIVVPVAVMPLLMLGMGMATVKAVAKARQEIPKIMILGGEDSPKTVAALRELKTVQVVPAGPDYTNQISEKRIRAAVALPQGFDTDLAAGTPTVVHIYVYQGEIKSSLGAQNLEQFFRNLRETTVRTRLTARNVPEQLLRPFDIRQTNVASAKKVSANVLGSIIPYLIILFCFTGGMYPAIDLTAGEKERGTMETLLCSPVARTHLVLGKFLMVLTASLATTMLSLGSMGFSLAGGRRLLADGMGRGALPVPLAVDVPALAAVFAMVLPLAICFSAVQVAIALFSRSAKEAQSYLGPLTVLIIFPAIASVLPGVEINARLALIPILNTSLISKEILSGAYHWNYIALIFCSACLYGAAALGAAVWLFQRETVLFRS